MNMVARKILYFSFYFGLVSLASSLEFVRKCVLLQPNISVSSGCGPRHGMNFACCPKNEAWIDIDQGLRLSEQKCEEYSSYVFTSTSVLESKTRKIQLNSCGQKPNYYRSNKIPDPDELYVTVHLPARHRQFPHAVALGGGASVENATWRCTGALISNYFILTAAHCLNDEIDGPLKYALFDELTLYPADNGGEDSSVNSTYELEELFPHPKFVAGQIYDDIGLVKLKKKLEFNIFVRPACLSNQFDGPETKAFSYGFRDLDFGGTVLVTVLEYAVVEKITQDECSKAHQENENATRGIDYKTQLCIAYQDGVVARACGDESLDGILQVYHNSKYCMFSLTGIKSSGGWCSTLSNPSIYTRVYPYLDWIEGIVWGKSTSRIN